MNKTTLVSAAILMRGNSAESGYCNFSEYLLARRPKGKVYAGWWEFPGGKVEAGESFHAALVRELHEELGIIITQASPWLTREFVYPHATVRIRFFRVSKWEGDIRPLEHEQIIWQIKDAVPSVESILPANGPIIKSLSLPTVCALTNAEENGIDAELVRLEKALNGGLRFVQVRDKTLTATARTTFSHTAVKLAHAHKALALINDDQDLARSCGADGLHLTSSSLMQCSTRPNFAWVGASCHNAEELQHASKLELDYVLLSPVLPTQTHTDASGIGWKAFSELIECCPMPVFALGGMQPDMQGIAQQHGAHGIALMRTWE